MTASGRFVRFSLVGALGIGVQLVAIWLLTVAGMHYLPATVVGVSAAILHNFVWHRRWTWAERAAGASVLVTLTAFTLANGTVSLAGNVVLMAVLVGAFGVPPVGANAIAIAVCGCVNFWLGDAVVFNARFEMAEAGASAPSSPPATFRYDRYDRYEERTGACRPFLGADPACITKRG